MRIKSIYPCNTIYFSHFRNLLKSDFCQTFIAAVFVSVIYFSWFCLLCLFDYFVILMLWRYVRLSWLNSSAAFYRTVRTVISCMSYTCSSYRTVCATVLNLPWHGRRVVNFVWLGQTWDPTWDCVFVLLSNNWVPAQDNQEITWASVVGELYHVLDYKSPLIFIIRFHLAGMQPLLWEVKPDYPPIRYSGLPRRAHDEKLITPSVICSQSRSLSRRLTQQRLSFCLRQSRRTM